MVTFHVMLFRTSQHNVVTHFEENTDMETSISTINHANVKNYWMILIELLL